MRLQHLPPVQRKLNQMLLLIGLEELRMNVRQKILLPQYRSCVDDESSPFVVAANTHRNTKACSLTIVGKCRHVALFVVDDVIRLVANQSDDNSVSDVTQDRHHRIRFTVIYVPGDPRSFEIRL